MPSIPLLSSLRLPQSRHGAVNAALALMAFLLCLYTQSVPNTSAFGNEALRDLFVKANASTAPEPRIIVVDIDESSTARLGPWPWPRERVADLVETLLTDYGARGVALDIVFPDSADAAGDARLAALAGFGPVVLAHAFDFMRDRPVSLRQGTLAPGMPQPAGQALPATGFIANHAGLAESPHVGNIGFVPDADGVLRRLPIRVSFEGRTYPALSLALLTCCSGSPAPSLADGHFTRVDFRRDWSAYTVVTAADVLAGAFPRGDLAGRLVLVGSSSLGQGDRVATPLGNNRPGLGVQAAMLSQLLDLQEGKAPTRWPGALLALLFSAASALFAMFAFPRLPAVTSVGLLGLISAAWVVLAFFASRHDPVFSVSGPLATNLFLLTFAVPYQWQVSQTRSRHLLDTLRQYVAPEVVAQLLRSDLADPLAPRRLDVTTLIADMEGYTSQVENLTVEESALLTIEFLDCLTGPVIATQGTLDKYTGDGLVAFWGAPLPIDRHADLALDAACEIVARVASLSATREALGHPRLRVRIGVESGLAMAGDFGTSFRSIYTAVGDSVNTASRLEHAAREFPHDVIVGAGTVERARRHTFIELDERLLRGKGKPTMLYTPASIESST